MAIAFIVGAAAASTNDNSATTSGVDTTGANFLIIAHADFSTRATESDSKGNTYTDLTAQNVSGSRGTQLHYCENPTVGSAHTATASATTSYPAVAFGAFSGVATSSSFDQQNGATFVGAGNSDISTGSVTPSEANEVVITAVTHSSTGATIPSGYTQIGQVAASANAVGLALAYQIQTTATATNPNWVIDTNSNNLAAVIATFKQAGAGGTRPVKFAGRWGGYAGAGGGFAA